MSPLPSCETFPGDQVDTDGPHHAEMKTNRWDWLSTGGFGCPVRVLTAGILPLAWKVAAIKVIPKPGKDDYSRPKSYRPIGLLCNGKNRGKDARLPHQMAYHAEAATRQYGFMPQRGRRTPV
ncbi:hypothetical protein EVAR_23341_1 [Eumeta japonica]|uniref:Uncharacterized protein n=1 Tax=Eumeta variegata TaxID=151549 RepID=A0A4C1XY93_EUMVA|nr:hypothetical protein EVAR_23341_1 [Eumeta japonica]